VLEIWKKSSSSDQSNLAEIYNKIGAAHQAMGRCPIATQYFEKAIEIQKKSLPFDHPDFIETYKNIAAANQLKGDILTTVSYWEKMCHIQQRDLSNNRLSHSSSSDNFEAKHQEMVYTSKAISQMKQVFESQQRLFSSDHGVADWTGNDIDEVKHMSEVCSGLIENLEAAYQVQQASSTSGNPFIPNTYSNDGAENQTTDNYLNAILSAVKDVQKLLPANHNESTSTENDASVTQSTTNNMLIAQQSFQQIMESCQKLHLPNDPSAAVYYDHIGNGLCSMGDYWSALTFFEKALEIILTSLSNNHPLLAKTYSNMAKALDGCGRYKEAVDCAEQAVTTARQNFESTSVEIEAYENQLLQLQQKMGLCIKS
jgi:tetratricopeptide (TPR) repeat protein